MYITFDDFYSIKEYNSFIENAKKRTEIQEYISLKPPHHWYIKIKKEHLPLFLRFKIASDSTERFLVQKIKPLYPSEEMQLIRRESTSLKDFERFVSPKIFQKVKHSSYAVLFRYKNKQELIKITKESPVKIYDLGQVGKWNLAMCFNKYIRNYIFSSWILIEKTKESEFVNPGDFEQYLNYKILVTSKFDNKTFEYPFVKDGVYTTLKRLT